jgi:hypothetical protein
MLMKQDFGAATNYTFFDESYCIDSECDQNIYKHKV